MTIKFERRDPWWKVWVNSSPEIGMIMGSIFLAILGIASTIFAIGASIVGFLGLVAKRRKNF